MIRRYKQVVREIQMELFAIDSTIYQFSQKRKELKAKLVTLGVGTKTCTKCKEELDIDQFYRDGQKPDGRSAWCCECVTEAQKERSRRKRAA